MTPNELRARRLHLGWSRNQLAHTLGVPIDDVSDWEEGVRPIKVPAAVEQVFRQYESKRMPDSNDDRARAS